MRVNYSVNSEHERRVSVTIVLTQNMSVERECEYSVNINIE